MVSTGIRDLFLWLSLPGFASYVTVSSGTNDQKLQVCFLLLLISSSRYFLMLNVTLQEIVARQLGSASISI